MWFARFSRPLILALLALALCSGAFAADFFISVTVAPPPLPVYVQPPCPEAGWIWAPGYWAWGDYGFYWVPGTWVPAPEVGLLWTPGYWGWDDGFYVWHVGYWGPEVGFYGGIDYGFGYFGEGFVGGEWRGDRFYYNAAVVNVNRTQITYVYENREVIRHQTTSYVSYNGGTGGIQAAPTSAQLAAARQTHIQPTSVQLQQVQAAQNDPALRAKNNHGRPDIAATSRAGMFSGEHVTHASKAGGDVGAATLNATPKSMPEARKGSNQPHGANGPGVGTQQATPERGITEKPSSGRQANRGGNAGKAQPSEQPSRPSRNFGEIQPNEQAPSENSQRQPRHSQPSKEATRPTQGFGEIGPNNQGAGQGQRSGKAQRDEQPSRPSQNLGKVQPNNRGAGEGGHAEQPNSHNLPHSMASPMSPAPRQSEQEHGAQHGHSGKNERQ